MDVVFNGNVPTHWAVMYVDSSGNVREMSNLPIPVFDSPARDAFAYARGLLSNGQNFLPSPYTAYPSDQVPLEIGDTQKVTEFYTMAFKRLQQINCRLVAKSFIKLIEPRKQVKHPYNGRRRPSGAPGERGDPEDTKPDWWPRDVIHKEPDHLRKEYRVQLLVHLVQNLLPMGITADLFEESVGDVRRHLVPQSKAEEKAAMLEEIIRVRKIEERYLRNEIDGTAQVHVTDHDGARGEEVESEDESEPKLMTPPQSVSSSPRMQQLEASQSTLEMGSITHQVSPQDTIPSFQMPADLSFTNPVQRIPEVASKPPEFGHPILAYAPIAAPPLTSTHNHFIETSPTSHLYAVSPAHTQASPPAGFTGSYPASPPNMGSPVDHGHGAGGLMPPQVPYPSQPFTVPDLSHRRGHEMANMYSPPFRTYSLSHPHTVHCRDGDDVKPGM